MDKWLKTGTIKRSTSRTEIRTTFLAAMEITVDQQDDNHEVQRPTDCRVQTPSGKLRLSPSPIHTSADESDQDSLQLVKSKKTRKKHGSSLRSDIWKQNCLTI
ncbi:hypothetical protein AVEN_127522-1 [Araneus ventricosus]|uniref:Uncharacterized protein n=1 Tax=Araneus ventricosus TaxID=182803 RepID=A0A4Y2MHX3_ARAVE|nr:hypothetical protein AVEN_127522-1 [Araneus ventricosus]